MIHARDLVKRFGELVAVDGIDLDVRRGEAFGFLGPNGAGKSSTMRMIGCVSPVSGGMLRILGLDPADVEVDPVDGDELAEALDQVACVDHRALLAHGPTLPASRAARPAARPPGPPPRRG